MPIPLFLLILVFIGVSFGLVWYLLGSDKGQKEPIWALWLAAGFGVFGAVAAGYIEGHLVHGLVAGAPHSELMVAAVAVGVIEEACKFVPLAIWLYRKPFFNEHTDGVIYFALAGLGFGLPENILYSMEYGVQTGLTRLFLTPLFHAAATGSVGFFLARQKMTNGSPWLVAVPLALMMALHAVYNFGLSSGSPLYASISLFVTLNISASLFFLYVKAKQEDQDMGLSVVGHNTFCRSCGAPNPRGHLYCTRCGKNA